MTTEIENHYQMAMIHAVEKLAPNPGVRLMGALATHFDHPALNIQANWPVLLECSEQDIRGALVEYTYRQIDRLQRSMAACETEISQHLAEAATGFRNSDQARELAEKWAQEAWELYRSA